MTAAYLLFDLFTLVYGRLAAYNRRAERVLMPLLDVLQSVPILSFLPVVLLEPDRHLPRTARRRAGFDRPDLYQPGLEPDLCLVPVADHHPQRAARGQRHLPLNPWMRFKTLELPFGADSA